MSLQTLGKLIISAANAIEKGETKKAAIFLHQALKLNFTYPVTWRLLQNLLDNDQDLSEFQISFAEKYYPQHVELLKVRKTSLEDEIRHCIPVTGYLEPYPCPYCDQNVSKYSVVCPRCKEPLGLENQPSVIVSEKRRLIKLKLRLASAEKDFSCAHKIRAELGESLSLAGLIFLGSSLSSLLSWVARLAPPISIFIGAGWIISLAFLVGLLIRYLSAWQECRVHSEGIRRLEEKINSFNYQGSTPG